MLLFFPYDAAARAKEKKRGGKCSVRRRKEKGGKSFLKRRNSKKTVMKKIICEAEGF